MKHKNLRNRLLSLVCTGALALSLLPGAALAAGAAAPAETRNEGGTYNGNWAIPVRSYLYQDGQNLVRVEYDPGQKIYNVNTGQTTVTRPEQVVVETYDASFQLQDTVTLEPELPLWGGFFAGEDYNFLIFGQENPSESDSTEVIRVVKYDKDWNRLGQASLRGANTYIPFDAGSLRCDEYNGYLYVRTAHEMYASSDGLHHQANLTFSVRERDMAITDSFSGVANTSAGYVSHSFNQFILVDDSGNIVTLDHGDAYPRGAVLMRYNAKAGNDKFITANGSYWNAVSEIALVQSWSGGAGANTTGAQVTDLAETSSGYLSAFSDIGKGASSKISTDVTNVYLAYTSKSNVSDRGTTVRQLTSYGSSSSIYGSQPRLVPTGDDGGYILWSMAEKADNGYFYSNNATQYARYSADGTISSIQTAENAPLSSCHPIVFNGQVVWYTTNDSAPTFYTLDESGVTAHPTDGQETEQPTEPEQPQEPEQPTDPGEIEEPGADQSGIMTSPNTTFASGLAIKEDGTLWGWGEGLSAWGKTWDGSSPVQLGSGYIAVWGDVDEAYLLKEDGTLWFRGPYLPYYGYLDETSTVPIQILDNVVQFCNGTALKADGSVWSILPPSEDVYDPDVLFYHIMDDAKQISGGLYGGEFGMALKNDGTLWSWSNNPSSNGAVGWPVGEDSVAPLTQILDGVAYVSGTMAIRTDGSLWSWGDNYFGAVGDGSGQDRYAPVKVLDHVVGAWCYPDGEMTTKYALTQDGTLYSWGFGPLGYEGGNAYYESNPMSIVSSFPYQTVPRKVEISDVANLWVGKNIVYVLKNDGSLWGTGSNYQGHLMRPDDNEEATGFVRLMDDVMLPQGTQSETGDNTTSFSDVPTSFWGHTYIIKAAQANLMSGVGSGQFDPNGSLTLAQAAVLAYQIHSQANGGTLPDAAGAWYMPYYQYCLDNGIFTASQFAAADMDRQATRFDMVSILDQAVPASRMTAVKTVADGSIPDLRESDPYGDVVYKWYRAGVVSGDGEGRFNGSTGITRAEVAVILCQLNNLV